MLIISLNIIICTSLLLVINFVLSKSKFLIDNPESAHHKYKHQEIIPLSGGIYFLLSTVIISFNNYEIKILIYLLPFLLIGIIADTKKEFSPKIRLIFQLLFFFILVNVNEIKISSVDFYYFDYLLENSFFNLIFVVFCLVTVLNGHNFMDGLNGFVIGNSILILFSMYFVNLQLPSYTFNMSVLGETLIIIFFVFFLFNSFGKCFLGDNGIYINSILISLLIISFIENSKGLVSPLLAAAFLWYPAFENLFSILRRIKRKKAVYRSDKLHLHSLVNDYFTLKFKNKLDIKKINTISALIINTCLLPNFLLSIIWYNSSTKLLILIFVQIILYIFIYNKILVLKK